MDSCFKDKTYVFEKNNFEKKTFFEVVRNIYSRDNQEIYCIKDFNSSQIQISDLSTLYGSEFKHCVLSEGKIRQFNYTNDYVIWELKYGHIYFGLVCKKFIPSLFELWMIELILSTSKIFNTKQKNINYEKYTSIMTEKYEKEFKNNSLFDEWEKQGISNFKMTVNHFTSRWETINVILPGFPCKSSNLQKVSGASPDKGEELALTRIIEFVKSINKIYPPGMVFWIVSDGHVFSDCIGVDDLKVNDYSLELKKLYSTLDVENKGYIKFGSLCSIFRLNETRFVESLVDDVEILHHLDTNIDDESELCRKILTKSCDTDHGKLEIDIHTPGNPRLNLFRGFSRFMYEDLALHPFTTKLSKKKFKKLVSKVGFEMIKRNDAYSNLIELFFPFFLRFSIHSHDNSGPKFSIRLLGFENCSVIKTLMDFSTPSYDDLLHIPTPWHNSIVKINDKDPYYVVKSKEILNVINCNKAQGGWNEKKKYFEIKIN